MHLWNDYEGKTIADAYPLEKLLWPEGRSAFFETKNGSGKPNVIRLTESLNDEHEMLERWRQVSAVHQENLVEIRTFGQTTFDGVPLAYALMEPADSNLAEILADRPLTVVETLEVASSLVAALSALHESGLIHERIEPANVLACGDVIKLRSDCVRECTEDGEFTTVAMCEELKRKDVQDLGTLLLRCLTLERAMKPGLRLGAPFDRVIPKALDGSWSLAEIAAVVRPAVAKPVEPVSAMPVRPVSAAGPGMQAAGISIPPATSRPAPLSAARGPLVPEQVTAVTKPIQAALPFSGEAETPTLRVRRIEPEAAKARPAVPRSWLIGGGAAVLLLLLAWIFVPSRKGGPAVVAPAAANQIQTIDDAPDVKGTATSLPSVKATKPSSVSKASSPNAREGSAAVLSGQPGWRVVCYTFTRQEDAWTRAGAIRKAHPSLNPQVFQPTSRGPFLLTLGGAMTRPEAESMLRAGRRDGMPRDAFARFYQGR